MDPHLPTHYIIEHPNLTDTKAILRLSQTTQPLDSAPTDLGGLMSEMDLKRIADRGPIMGIQPAQIHKSLWR